MNELKEQILDKIDVREPSMYKVILMNDNYTTMDFVIMILMMVFHKTHDEAQKVMLQVHKDGKGIAGVYPFEIAETKIKHVEALAEKHRFPLRCAMEED